MSDHLHVFLESRWTWSATWTVVLHRSHLGVWGGCRSLICSSEKPLDVVGHLDRKCFMETPGHFEEAVLVEGCWKWWTTLTVDPFWKSFGWLKGFVNQLCDYVSFCKAAGHVVDHLDRSCFRNSRKLWTTWIFLWKATGRDESPRLQFLPEILDEDADVEERPAEILASALPPCGV